jgi:hypothetical protein
MQDGQMAQYTELCDYSSEGHKKLREINEKFNQICNLLVYELVCIET